MIAAVFAALYTTRMGFMFGMISGAIVCRKAGIPINTFSAQIPKIMEMIVNYHKYFAETIEQGFESNEASIQTYSSALDDTLATYKELGAADDVPKLFSDLTRRGLDAGLNDKALTALIDLIDGQQKCPS